MIGFNIINASVFMILFKYTDLIESIRKIHIICGTIFFITYIFTFVIHTEFNSIFILFLMDILFYFFDNIIIHFLKLYLSRKKYNNWLYERENLII